MQQLHGAAAQPAQQPMSGPPCVCFPGRASCKLAVYACVALLPWHMGLAQRIPVPHARPAAQLPALILPILTLLCVPVCRVSVLGQSLDGGEDGQDE